MGAPKRSPSFSHRPGFPSGLRVLLVDSDVEARARTEEQLRACDYSVTSCASCAEAVVQLSSCSASAFDVLLADKGAIGCVAAATAAGAAAKAGRSGLLDSCRGVPCILMAADPSPDDVMQGVSLGAVDFLAKPLSQLKLRNIWQHTVRKMMGDMRIQCGGKPEPLDRTASSLPAALACIDEQQPQLQPQQQPQQQQQQQQLQQDQHTKPGLPPRSPGVARPPPVRALRAGHRPPHACVSSTNLAASGPEPMDDDAEFDFEAAEPPRAPAPACDDATCAAPRPAAPAPAPSVSAATAACTAATATATATATHMTAPVPSCGVPVSGALAPLSAGMVRRKWAGPGATWAAAAPCRRRSWRRPPS
ncbi:hypothetical protein MNEG_11334 [Monoraphidium neglectum]|uniref:Response regulatory domain-containing protein n=1 Tax=Monoraphidium neglectum TaxID=145388 RepID=A0A0D2LZ31_9CHLO|nr:hypothetical protein MNEG_11334 [Monoraphidium neglectum]KIY96629.1 hypothetical protein MNEG_11334 [Monoraphidium neglectum]|eukprot:XP_013895649.1 hypothetical protein MNEG_11334 [Monoraphidium neglectum]